ncbi:MAG TPA: sulfite exporter TauE/SafE family protein [Flavobacteriales bacterium]|nr:sulfite exporter TauE/SafE family protein [Flavobacteriales bacterium]
MEILGYIASLFIGIALGLIGGGGSILTVPVLYYLFGVAPVLATAYSLFIVGITSLVGVLPKYRQGLVNMKTAIIFGAPSIIAVFATRKYIIPVLPEHMADIGAFELTKPVLLMVVFAILMLAASISMIRSKTKKEGIEDEQVFNYPLIFVEGTIVGILTGFVGAGGGFLIIPALVLLSKLPMKQAIGTSLIIIAAKSLIGFTGDLGHTTIDWTLIIFISLLAIVGIFIGNKLSEKLDGEKLKKGFGWFVLVMGAYILISELFFSKIK